MEMTDNVLELLKYIDEWASNPLHWSNNKRRLHGYPTLRKASNNKFRLFPNTTELYNLIQKAIDEAVITRTKDICNDFVDIKDINI